MNLYNILSINGINIDEYLGGGGSSEDINEIKQNTFNLNTDVVSLYNICNSLSNSISTITGGGGGGDYYYNLSDLVSKSYNYMYNVTGNYVSSDLPSYSPFTIAGYIGTISDFNLGSEYSTVCFSGVDLISSGTLSSNNYVCLNANTISSINAFNVNCLKLNGNEIVCSSIQNINNLFVDCMSNFNDAILDSCHNIKINAPLCSSIKITYGSLVNLDCLSINKATLNDIKHLNCNCLSLAGDNANVKIDLQNVTKGTINGFNAFRVGIFVCNEIVFNAFRASNVSYKYISTLNISCESVFSCYFSTNAIINFNASALYNCGLTSNTIFNFNVSTLNSCNMLNNYFVNPINISNFSKNNITMSDCDLNLNVNNISSASICGHAFTSTNPLQFDLNLNVKSSISSCDFKSFKLISLEANNAYGSLYFESINTLILNVKNPFWSNTSKGFFYPHAITLLDVRQITQSITVVGHPDCGANTMKLNCDWRWTTTNNFDMYILPNRFSTMDFYNVENYLSNNIFTIPAIYSGYDENNIWISGKPLSYYSYTLSLSSAL